MRAFRPIPARRAHLEALLKTRCGTILERRLALTPCAALAAQIRLLGSAQARFRVEGLRPVEASKPHWEEDNEIVCIRCDRGNRPRALADLRRGRQALAREPT